MYSYFAQCSVILFPTLTFGQSHHYWHANPFVSSHPPWQPNNDCSGAYPKLQYGVCSPDVDQLLLLYRQSANNFRDFVRRQAATVIPAHATLVWPGVTLETHLGGAFPAWSSDVRPADQKFADWVLNEDYQCSKGTEDNSVCAKSAFGQKNKVVVNPWLGGDFNPWERCDTESTGITSQGVGVNEAVSVSCHPAVCPRGIESAYYTNQPNQECLNRVAEGKSQVRLLGINIY